MWNEERALGSVPGEPEFEPPTSCDIHVDHSVSLSSKSCKAGLTHLQSYGENNHSPAAQDCTFTTCWAFSLALTVLNSPKTTL